MNLKQKIQQIKEKDNYTDKKLYLIELLKDNIGFLFGNEKLYFAVESNGLESESIQTTYLSFRTNIFVNTIEDSPSFKPGNYDLLIYTGNFDELFFESFVELCTMFANSNADIMFNDFFYSLLKLFEVPKETSYTNLVGLFGELAIIKEFYEKHAINIADNWHNSLGTNDKYDFAFPKFNIEVKTTSKESTSFEIKHSQIFNEKNNYVAVVNVQNDNSGITVADLFDFFKNNSSFASNINFWINMQKEKLKVNPTDFSTKRLTLCKISFYLNKDLDTIKNIPECVEKITYTYNFSGKKNTAIEDLAKEI